MKNTINYFYDIVIDEFKKSDTSFIFYYKGLVFEFVEYYGELNKLLNIYSVLKSYHKETDEIIVNNRNEFVTYYDNKPYILLKKANVNNNLLSLNDIFYFDNIVYINEKIVWKELWIQKLDYYEYQLNEVGIKYPYLKESFYYYLGLSECAIELLNYVNYDNINIYISHRRLERKKDLYNLLNIVFDSRSRDFAEYIKIKYINEEINFEEIIIMLDNLNLTKDEVILFLSRLIFPTYYFDIYEQVYMGKKNEKDIKKIVIKNNYYEEFLKKIYLFLRTKYNIPYIDFLA